MFGIMRDKLQMVNRVFLAGVFSTFGAEYDSNEPTGLSSGSAAAAAAATVPAGHFMVEATKMHRGSF